MHSSMEEKDGTVARKPGNVCDTVSLVDSAAADLGLPRGVCHTYEPHLPCVKVEEGLRIHLCSVLS